MIIIKDFFALLGACYVISTLAGPWLARRSVPRSSAKGSAA
jgi:hypothetical protein